MSTIKKSGNSVTVDLENKRVIVSADLKGLTEQQLRGAETVKTKFVTGADRLRYMLDCVAKVEGGAGASIVTLEHVSRVVEAQMELNKCAEKTIMVGSGKNIEAVKYEQRAITPKWIMEKTLTDKNAGIEGARAVNQAAAIEFINMRADVQEHNRWLCTSNGIEPTAENIQNFNRRTGKAAARAAAEGVK